MNHKTIDTINNEEGDNVFITSYDIRQYVAEKLLEMKPENLRDILTIQQNEVDESLIAIKVKIDSIAQEIAESRNKKSCSVRVTDTIGLFRVEEA